MELVYCIFLELLFSGGALVGKLEKDLGELLLDEAVDCSSGVVDKCTLFLKRFYA